MAKTFREFEEDAHVSEHLKEMLIAEVDIIRDVMQIVQMFVGENMLVAVKLLQELEPKQPYE